MERCRYVHCNNRIDVPKGTVQYYCSKICRYLGRGSKRGKRLARRLSIK